tara:strand:+ start:2792 stop:4138 length:1347 start_codon:yes stop_codon:yes gene_type:complete
MEQIPDAASSLLAFSDVKRRAISSRCYRVKVPTSNGTSFTPGQTMNLDLAGNMQNSYYDFAQSYLLMTITNTGVATPANDATLDGHSGAYSTIDRVQCITGGQTVSDIQQYNVLAAALMAQNTSPTWGMNVGSNLIGSSVNGDPCEGLIIAGAGGSQRVALPFILTALSNTTPQRYIPAFSRDMLRFRYYLASNVVAVKGTAPVIAYSEVEAVMYIVELSPDAQALVNSMCGGVYNILCGDYRTVNGSFVGATGGLTTVQTLGFAVSSLERVIVVMRNSAVEGQGFNSVGARSLATLSEYQLFINGEAFPARPVVLSGTANAQGYGAEAWAETLVAQHALSDFTHDCSVSMGAAGIGVNGIFPMTNATGANAATTGQSLVAVELESMAGKSSSLYSGISTIGSVVQFRGVFSGAAAINGETYNMSFFAQNTILLSLDMNGLGTFVVSV